MDTEVDEQHSEPESLSENVGIGVTELTQLTVNHDNGNDHGLFLSGSCVKTDEKTQTESCYPFVTDSGLHVSAKLIKIDPEFGYNIQEMNNGSMQQTSDSDSELKVTVSPAAENESRPNHCTGSAYMHDNILSPLSAKSTSVHHVLSPNIVLLTAGNGADQRHFQRPSSESDSSESTPILFSNQVIIGNSDAAHFVKNVLKNSSTQSFLQNAFQTSLQSLNLPPGYAILDTTSLAQTSLQELLDGEQANMQTPLVIQWPTLVTTDSNFNQGIDTVSSLVQSVQPDITATSEDETSDSLCADRCSTLLSVLPNTSDSESVTSLLSKSFSDSIFHEEASNNSKAFETNTNEHLRPELSISHPVVISCNPVNAGSSEALRQVIDYFVQHQSKIQSDGLNNSVSEKSTGDDHLATCHAKSVSSGNASVNAVNALTASPFALINSEHIIPSFQHKSNSIIFILPKEHLNTKTLQSSILSRPTCSTETDSSLGHPPVSRQVLFGMKDETDGADAILQTASIEACSANRFSLNTSGLAAEIKLTKDHSAISAGSSFIVQKPTVSKESDSDTCTLQEPPLNSFANASSTATGDNSEQPRSDISFIISCQSPACNDVQSTCTNNKLQNQSLSVSNNIPEANNHTLIPLTVTEKLPSEVRQPIFIYVVLEDGATKQIIINPSTDTTDAAANKAKPAPSTSLDFSVAAVQDSQTSDGKALQVPGLALGEDISINLTNDEEQNLRQPDTRPTKEAVSHSERCPNSTTVIKCDLCSAVFSRQSNYKRHRKIHTLNLKDDHRFKCPHCERPFLQRCDMKRHIAVHTHDYPFKCNTCGKGYIRKSDLVVHERFHSRERAFSCDLCTRSFYQTGDLRRHKRAVHAEEPYSLWPCSHCNRKYTREVNLIQHVKSAHDDILANIADQMQEQMESLNSTSLTS